MVGCFLQFCPGCALRFSQPVANSFNSCLNVTSFKKPFLTITSEKISCLLAYYSPSSHALSSHSAFITIYAWTLVRCLSPVAPPFSPTSLFSSHGVFAVSPLRTFLPWALHCLSLCLRDAQPQTLHSFRPCSHVTQLVTTWIDIHLPDHPALLASFALFPFSPQYLSPCDVCSFAFCLSPLTYM